MISSVMNLNHCTTTYTFAEMDDSAQEELVGLIFGENPPEGWKDLPEFQLYLSELGNYIEERMSLFDAKLLLSQQDN